MMKNILAPLLLLFFVLSSHAQLYDAQWLMGYKGPGEGDYALLDFSGDTVRFQQIDDIDILLRLGSPSSFICDGESGELLLLTNNCELYDGSFNPVPGGGELTPGMMYDFSCVEDNWYPVPLTNVILPEMGNDSIFYVVHKDGEIDEVLENVVCYNFYLSTVVKKTDGSLELVEKRKLVEDGLMNASYLTAGLNNTGDRWWVWVNDYNSNSFQKFLIGGLDIAQGPFIQEIGDNIISAEIGIGHATFSPDGTLLGFNGDFDAELKLYDFDNSTGELSNYRTIAYPDSSTLGMGLAFSPDSKLAYVTSGNDLFQVDIAEGNAIHIAHHESLDEGNWPVGMGYLYSGPDCRIYVAPGTTTYYLHAVHHPNEKGMACGFQPRAIRAPNSVNFNLPNLPQYRFNGACDSTIAFPPPPEDTVSVATQVVAEMGVEVFPNPFKEHLTISFTERMPNSAKLLLYDQMGRPVLDRPLPAGTNLFETSSLSTGVYFYEVREKERRVTSGMVVKVNR